MDTTDKKNWLSGSLILTIAPFLGYLTITAFEMGFVNYFHIPYEWISLGFTNLCIATVVGLWLTFLLLFSIQFFIQCTPLNFWEDTQFARLRRWVNYFIGVVFIFAMFFAVTMQDLFWLGFDILALILFSFILFFWVEIRKKNLKHKIISEKSSQVVSHRNIVIQSISKEPLRTFFICLVGIPLFLFFIFMAGNTHAKRKDIFWVVRGSDKVVLRIYGDYMICGELDRVQQEVCKIERIKKSADNSIPLDLEITGRLKFKKSIPKGNS